MITITIWSTFSERYLQLFRENNIPAVMQICGNETSFTFEEQHLTTVTNFASICRSGK